MLSHLPCHARVIKQEVVRGLFLVNCYKDAKKWNVAECSEYSKIRKNKQTNEATRPEESEYDIENQSAHTYLVSSL